MISKAPIVRQVAWLSIIPQLCFLLVLIYLAKRIGFENAIFGGVALFIMVIFIVRYQIPKHHRKGIAFFKKKSFAEAIPHFKESYEFFKRNAWVDRFRFLTLLSSSSASYTEMALLNMAFCYSQIGNGKASKELYELTLSEFPDSEIAKASVKMFESAKNITEPPARADAGSNAVI